MADGTTMFPMYNLILETIGVILIRYIPHRKVQVKVNTDNIYHAPWHHTLHAKWGNHSMWHTLYRYNKTNNVQHPHWRCPKHLLLLLLEATLLPCHSHRSTRTYSSIRHVYIKRPLKPSGEWCFFGRSLVGSCKDVVGDSLVSEQDASTRAHIWALNIQLNRR